MAAQSLSKSKTTNKKPDISDYEIKLKYIPLEEAEENQRLRQLCFLLFQEVLNELQGNTEKDLTSV